MSEYRGFKYTLKFDAKWQLVYPSGFKTMVTAIDENLVKQMIDSIIREFGNG